MATYTSTQVSGGTVPINERGASFLVFGSIALTTALAANDVVQLLNVPNGYKILNVTLDSDALDSGVSKALKANLGDASVATPLSQPEHHRAGGRRGSECSGGIHGVRLSGQHHRRQYGLFVDPVSLHDCRYDLGQWDGEMRC